MRVPLLNFEGGNGVPLLNFEGGSGILLLNFRGVPGLGSQGNEVPGSRVLVPLLHHAIFAKLRMIKKTRIFFSR